MFRLRSVLCGFLVVALVACARKEVVLPGQFIQARFSPDRASAIITFHRPVAVDGKYFRGHFIGGNSEPMPNGLVAARSFVGVYDLKSQTFRVLVRKDNTELLRDSGKLWVHDMIGDTAFIDESRQLRNYAEARNNHYLLNISSGAFSPLPLNEELALRGAQPIHTYLIDADGTLVIDTNKLGSSRFPDRDAGLGLWVRYPSGGYVRLSEDARYSQRRLGDEILYTPTSLRTEMAFNLRLRTTREFLPEERQLMQPSVPGDYLELRDGQVWVRNAAFPMPIGPALAIDTDLMK